MNILQAVHDPALFGRWFRDVASWTAWRAFMGALFGLQLSDEAAEVFRRCTGRAVAPDAPCSEAWLIIGRRGGKSFALAVIAVYLAAFRQYAEYLAPGERAVVLVIATDRRQARTIFRYVRALFFDNAMLAAMVARETADVIDLKNGVSIEVGTASHRSTRGYTIAAALCDELAFWPTDDSAEPDYAILDAVRPGMATIPGAMLLCASSPYAKRGALYDAFKRWYGRDDAPALVWKADTRTMNPTVAQSIIDRAVERDPASAAAEYGAEFRTDIAAFVAREVVEAAIDPGVHERPPIDGVGYWGFVDPSGGASDSMTLAIAHAEARTLTLDAVRERKPPFSPDAVVADYADLLKRYRIGAVHGDRYGGEWPREVFARHGITYLVSERTKADIYRDVLPELNSGQVALLDIPAIIGQFLGLERRTARGGRDMVDHSPGSHDDVANAVAGALLLAKPAILQDVDIGSPTQVDAGPSIRSSVGSSL